MVVKLILFNNLHSKNKSLHWVYEVLFTSSLALSTSFASLVRPLLVTVSISYGYTFTKGGIVSLWRMLCEAFAKHNELLKANGRGNNARSLHSNTAHKHQHLPKYNTKQHTVRVREWVCRGTNSRWALCVRECEHELHFQTESLFLNIGKKCWIEVVLSAEFS